MGFVRNKILILIKKIVFVVVFVFLSFFLLYALINWNKGYRKAIGLTFLEKAPKRVSSIDITVNERDYEFLFSDLPLSLRSFQKGKLIADGKPLVYNISLRLRGAHGWHWYKEKPSFRVRISGDNLLYGRKEFDLINPEDASGFSNVISAIMAAKVGVPHFSIGFCQVTLNGEYKGLYHISDRISSSNIRSLDGSDYSLVCGNNWDLNIWRNEKSWEYDENTKEVSREELEFKVKDFISLIVGSTNSEKFPSEVLKNTVDIEKTARWSAFMAIIGSLHTDDFHNNFFAYDKSKEVLFPLIADPTGFGVLTSISNKISTDSVELPIYEFLTPLFSFLFKDPEFQYKRNRYIYEFLKSSLSKEYVESLVDDWRKTITPLYEKEKVASALITVPCIAFPMRIPVSADYRKKDIDRLLEYYGLRVDFILKQLEQSVVEIYPYRVGSKNTKQYVISVLGHSPVRWDMSAFNGKVYADFNMDKIISYEERLAERYLCLYPALHKVDADYVINFRENWFLLQARLAKYILEPTIQTYLVSVDSDCEKEFLNKLENTGINAVTASVVKAVYHKEMLYKEEDLYLNKDYSFHCWSIHEKK